MKRIKELDIVKASCIIFMVIGHTHWKYMHIFLLFHMAVFFMISGYLFKDSYGDSLKSVFQFAVKRGKRLYIPWVIAQTVYLALNNLFLKLGLMTDNPEFLVSDSVKNLFGLSKRFSLIEFLKEEIKILLMGSGTQFGGSLWFLRALLVIEITFVIITWLSQKTNIKIRPLIIVLMFIIGRILTCVNFGKLDIIRIVLLQLLIPISAYYAGTICRKYHNKLEHVYSPVGFVVSCVVLLLLNYAGIHNDMSNGTMTNVAGYIMGTLSGFVFCISLAKIVLHYHIGEKLLIYIGQNTMPILVLHLLVFKLVTVLQIFLYSGQNQFPSFALASFPVLLSSGIWPYVYTIVGIAGSLLLNHIYTSIKSKLFKIGGPMDIIFDKNLQR